MGPYKNVLLIGASGNLGAPVLKAFMDSPYNVSILTRADSTSTFPEGVPVLKADYTSVSSVKAAMEGQDVVITMAAPIASDGQTVFIDAALAAGVKLFFPSEFGPASYSAGWRALNPLVNETKTGVVNYLKKTETQMAWCAVVTGGFFDWAMETGFFRFDLATRTVLLIDDGVTKFWAITLPMIGKSLVAMLDHVDDIKNKYVAISTLHMSQRDILEVLEKLEGKKWTVEHTTSEDLIATGKKRLAEGDFLGIKDLTAGGGFGKPALDSERPDGLWNEKVGLPKEDLEQALRDVLAKRS